jgi:hypothetical protein
MPALAGKEKKALLDEEMEEITAAGDPTVIVVDGDEGEATYTDTSVFSLAFPTGAQHGIRALTLQNVVGEVQLLVNLNVLSAAGDVAGTDQRNFSVQSWGSTLPIIGLAVDGVAAPGGDGAPGINQDGLGNINTVGNSPNCIGLGKCDSVVNAVGGPGGNAAAAQGVVDIDSASADVIVKAKKKAEVNNDPVFSLAMDKDAQTDIGALFVANIVGRAQTAFNINIAAATVNLIPTGDTTTPFVQPLGSASGVIKQVNSGVQFRGTPLGVGNTSATVNVNHTPN